LSVWRRFGRRLFDYAPIILFLAAFVSIAPWGNYPLNDDDLYAHAARNFVETGHIKLAPVITPALVGQIVLAAPFIKLFGFSHTLLRVLTILLGAFGIWALGRILRRAAVDARTRFVAQCALAFNPIYFCMSGTFMTEIYGWVPPLLGTCLWLWDRERQDRLDRPDGARTPIVSRPVALAFAVIAGSSFWIRQFCVLVYPAVVGGALLRLASLRDWRRLERSWLTLFLATSVFVLVVLLYFPWAAATGNESATFKVPFARLLSVDGRALVIETAVYIVYMTCFALPLLALIDWRDRRRLRHLLVGLALLVVGLGLPVLLRAYPDNNELHQRFPYLGNILYDTGLGAILLPENLNTLNAGQPHWRPVYWEIVSGLLSILLVLWTPLLIKLPAAFCRSKSTLAFEVLCFGLLLSGLSFVFTLQAYKFAIYDRYHLPGLIGALCVVGVMAPGAISRGRFMMGLIVVLPIALFSWTAAHDDYRWNDAIVTLLKRSASHGVPAHSVEDSFPYWDALEPSRPRGVVAPGRYRLSMTRHPNDSVIDSVQPDYWLADGPPVYLLRDP